MQFYWEAGHFKKALGDQVIEALLGQHLRFGQRLQAANVDAWVAQDRAAVQALLETPSPLRDEVDDVIRRARLP